MGRRSFRCSSLPRIIGCNASTKRPAYKEIEPLSEPASLGTAIHKALQIVVDNNLDYPPDLTKIIDLYDIEDVDELIRLIWTGVNAWKSLKNWMNVTRTEQKMECNIGDKWRLTGSADIEGMDIQDGLIIVDWKSGYVQKDVKHQLYGYAKLGLNKYQDIDHGKIIVVWLRHNAIEVKDFDRDYIDGEWTELLESSFRGHKYTPAPDFCDYCPNRFGCTAKNLMMRSAGTELIKADVKQKIPAILGNFYDRSKMLKNALKRYEDTMKQQIEDSGGSFEFPDGRFASFAEEERKEIDMTRSWPIIAQYFDCDGTVPELMNEIGTSMKFGKKDLMNFVKALAPRGEKGKAIASLMDDLEKAGAVTTKIIKKVKISIQSIEEREIND